MSTAANHSTGGSASYTLIKHMKPDPDSFARVVRDIAVQVLFYAALLAAFWLLMNLMP